MPAVQGDARHTRVVVSAGLAFYLALGVGLGVTGPSLVPMRTDFGLPYATVALVLVATGIGYLVGALVGGPLSDRYGRRRLMIGGTVGGCLGLAAVAVAPSFEMVFVAKVVTGLAYGVAEPTLTALLADAAREKSARAINIAQIAFAGGALLAPLMVGGLLASGLGWRPGFALGAGLFVLLAGAFALIPYPPSTRHAAPVRDIVRTAFAPYVALLGLLLALYVGLEIGFAGFSAAFLESQFGVERSAASAAVAIFWTGQVAGRMLGAWLVGRLDLFHVALLSAISATGFAALASLAPVPALALVALFFVGVASGSIFPNVMAIGLRRQSRNAGTVAGALFALTSVGGLAFPPVIGAVSDALDVRAGLLLVALAMLPAVGLLLQAQALDRRHRRAGG